MANEKDARTYAATRGITVGKVIKIDANRATCQVGRITLVKNGGSGSWRFEGVQSLAGERYPDTIGNILKMAVDRQVTQHAKL